MKIILSILFFCCLSQMVAAKMVTIRGEVKTISGEIPIGKMYVSMRNHDDFNKHTVIQLDSLGQFKAKIKLRSDYSLRILSANYETYFQSIRFRRKTPRFLSIKLKERTDNSSEEDLVSLFVNGFRIERQQADTSLIVGQINDEQAEPVMFANIALFQHDTVVFGTQTDFDGLFRFSNIPKGIYRMEVSYVGYYDLIIPFIEIKENESLKITGMMEQGINTDMIQVIIDIPIIHQDDLIQGTKFNQWEIQRSPHKN